MLEYLVKRTALLFVTLFGIALISFMIVVFAPGDPAALKAQTEARGRSAGITEFAIRKNRELFFLDRPVVLNTDPYTRRTIVGKALRELDSEIELERRDARVRLTSTIGTAGLQAVLVALPARVERSAAERDGRARMLDALEAAEMEALPRLLEMLAQTYPAYEPRLPRREGRPTPHELKGVWLRQRNTLLAEAEAPARRVLEVLSSETSWSNKVEGVMPAARGGPGVKEDTPLEEALLAWNEWWTTNQAAYTPSMGAAAARGWLTGEPHTEAGLRTVGQLAAPALMEALEEADEGSEAERRAAEGLALVCKKPWRLALSEEERGRFRVEWGSRSEALEEAKGKGTIHPSAYAKRKGALGTVEAYVAAREAEQVERRRMAWTDWWYRAEEYFVDFTQRQQVGRAFTQTQFGRWISRFVRLDFGDSYKQKRPVRTLLWERLKVTLPLNAISLFLTYLIAIPIGIYSATHKGSAGDRASTLVLFFLYSIPSFWAGAMLLMLFTGEPFLDWFPSHHIESIDNQNLSLPGRVWDWTLHGFLPVICLTYAQIAYLARQMRAGMLDVISQDFIRTARAKGLPEQQVVMKHALRNSLIPILTLTASLLPIMFGGSVIVETIFTIDGLGKLAFEAITDRDYPVIMANLVIAGFLTLLGILLTDIAYALVDPRIEYR